MKIDIRNWIVSAIIGIILALTVKQAFGYMLSTDLPLVAVVSGSMEHGNNIDATYYGWLEKNMNYTRDYIDSWPAPNGFSIGDMPVIKGTSDYKVGDVIVYSTPMGEYPIIHRIIKINEDGTYMTKGDSNDAQLPFEYHVKSYQIHGKVIYVVPKLGSLKVLVSRIFGF